MAVPAMSGSIEAWTGDAVRARRALWHVGAARRDQAITLLRLRPAMDLRRADRTLVHPFDRVEPLARRETLALVSRRHAMRALAELVIASPAFAVPASVASTSAMLLPFQLEPLIALRTGLAARVLIADHVGLGKTIQAALIARDLLATHPASFVLILTPAGLREQWQTELRDRAGLDSVLLDADTLRLRSAWLPPDANPWRSCSVVIASIDFVKQTDVLHGLRTLVWDLLVVDEAHTLTLGSDRLAAGQQIAMRSTRIVLLTATPHDGDATRFRTLCDLGRSSPSDVLAAFRRTREVAGALHRRVTRRIEVSPSPAERRLQRLLERYAQRVWIEAPAASRGAARLAMTVLFKRAASSPASLVRSLERRRALLTSTAAPDFAQPALPFAQHEPESSTADEDAEPDRVLAAPGLHPGRERTWLNLLIHAGVEAASDERKLRVLVRLVRRVREPLIVFTEYRDTLDRIEARLASVAPVVALHGGKTLEARADALRAFDAGAARVLVGTDAASEGLNLHRRCRLVVHVELPWSPTRLEQRIGRVDRLGQTRTVHTVHLVARDTVESRIEARLAERARRIQDALGDGGSETGESDPVASLDAALHARPATEPPPQAERPGRSASPASMTWPKLGGHSDRAVAWLASARRLQHGLQRQEGAALRGATETNTPPTPTDRRANRRAARCARSPIVARVQRSARRRLGHGRGWLYVYRTRFAHADGRLVEQTLTAIHVAGPIPAPFDARILAAQLAATRNVLDAHADKDAAARRDALMAVLERAEGPVALRREIIAARDRAAAGLQQLPLFGELVPADRGGGAPPDEEPGAADAGTAPNDALAVDWHLAMVLALE